jgi:hypothetical protein
LAETRKSITRYLNYITQEGFDMSNVISAQATTISGLLTEYTNYVSTSPVTITNLQNATSVLSTVFTTIITSPDPNSLMVVWNFFVNNQNGVVGESLALPGIGILSPDVRFKYLLVYSMFRQAANGLMLTSVDLMASAILNAPMLIVYLQEQSVTVPTTWQIESTSPTGSFAAGSGITFTAAGAIADIGLAPISAETLLGNPGSIDGIPSGIPIGTGLTFVDGVLTATATGTQEWSAGVVSSIVGATLASGVLTITGGTEGPQGIQGIQGPIGLTGLAGPAGAASTVPGPQGPVGAASTVAGPTGAPGAPGINGTQGIPGIQGPIGLTGPQGLAGAASTVPGPAGSPGTNGTVGLTGAGFSTAVINGSGHLVLTETVVGGGTGGTLDVGLVVGTNGTAGTPGAPGTPGTPGTTLFAGLTDGPETITASKFLKGNSTGTALQFFPGSLVQNFTFNITFTGTDPSAIANIPAGWTITIPTQDVILIQHNLGIQPIQVFIWGLTTVADTWTQRTVGGGSLNMS